MSKTHFSEFFPVNDPQSLRQTKHLNEEDRLRWRNFLNITRSEFIQEKLLKVQGGYVLFVPNPYSNLPMLFIT